MRKIRVLAVVAVVSVVLAACADEESRRIVVWTDIPEVAAYLELFNSYQQSYRAELQYREAPGEQLRRAEDQPDIVITRHLSNRETAERMRSLERVLSPNRVDPEAFYTELLERGSFDGTQRFLPISFDLPTIMFHRDHEIDLSSFGISASELQQHGRAFNERSGERFINMGFSPKWSNRFLYVFAQTHGARFREQEDEMPAWETERLEDALEALVSWDEEYNESAEEVVRFHDRYLYDPEAQLLLRNRIGFAYIDAGEFFAMRESQRELLEFRWYTDNSDGTSVPALDGPVSLGVPTTAANRSGAEAFIEWFYRTETHELLLQDLQRKRMQSFGILGGFSALRRVNEELFPRYYPELLGRVPEERFLRFPERQAVYWADLRSEVIEPWLGRRVSAEGAEESLHERLRVWLLRRGD